MLKNGVYVVCDVHTPVSFRKGLLKILRGRQSFDILSRLLHLLQKGSTSNGEIEHHRNLGLRVIDFLHRLTKS